VLVSLTYRPAFDAYRTAGLAFWNKPEDYAMFARRYNVAALGVNCGQDVHMDATASIVQLYRRGTGLPLFARPNAGTPRHDDGRFVYPRLPAEMAEGLPKLLEAGACLVGGCCGTTPDHIGAFRKVVDDWNTGRLRLSESPC
jgi:5-methyltetrahydrofolate--homocysteine methyltransferase